MGENPPMSNETFKVCVAKHGRTAAALEALIEQNPPYADWLKAAVNRRFSRHQGDISQLWITAAQDLDATFAKRFREQATQESRLLIMNGVGERQSADSLLARIMELQIRSSHRIYVAEEPVSGKHAPGGHLAALLQRLAATANARDDSPRIFNACIVAGVLNVISPHFQRLGVPLSQIPALAGQDPEKTASFEIDEDGSFIYWPKLGVHLGWEQLEQIVNPTATLKAKQKSADFNIRYGKAVQKVRAEAGLKPKAIELSEKQLSRIEKGECRLTSNAAEALAKAHGFTTNAYLQKLAEALPG
jgi:hypothetical protein